jgi:hypothetical protein
MQRRAILVAVPITLSALLAVAVLTRSSTPRHDARARGGAEEELLEQRETTERRLEALAEARAAGTFGTPEPVTHVAATGWAGEQVMNPGTDDWEPAIAADPNDPYVYILTTRYGEPKPCPGNCPTPFIALEISADGGRTWSEGVPLCACKGSGQFDPIIEVVPDTGHVYAAYMNGFNVVFTKSTDHGETWSDPVPTYGNVAWNDKDVLAASDDGRHVYVSWNGPNGGDAWVAQSHDFGETWTQKRITANDRYFFAFDADVLPDGTVVFSESSFTYTGPGASAEGVVRHHAFISRDRGTTWQNAVIDSVRLGPPCETEGCYADFHSGHNAVSADGDGDLVYVYDGATTEGGPQATWARTSTDGGATWSARVRLSPAGAHTTGPAGEAAGDGDFRVFFAQQNATGRWNVFYTRSRNGGASWSAPVKISDAVSGAGYKNANGFLEFYGDYGEIAVTSQGKTIATWGEGFSWLGPGGSWFNRER